MPRHVTNGGHTRGAPKRDEVADLIKRAPIFSGCSKKELRRIAAITQLVELPAGHELTREGEPGRDFVVLLEGGADVRRKGRRVAELGPGDWLGEISLLTGGPRTATVTTTAPSRALVIRGGMFRSLVETTPSIAYKTLVRVASLLPQS
jgi:CRP/FNR family cyclic AMP-dependent transcriptional regulator